MQKLNNKSRKSNKRSSVLLAVLCISALHACSSSESDSTPNENNADTTSPANTADTMSLASTIEPSGTLLGSTNIAFPESLRELSSAVQFDYSMESITGGTTAARAQLFEPLSERPVGGYPLVVWARDNTSIDDDDDIAGVANACAPSLSFDEFANDVAINALLATGYAVLAPDYEGFGTSAIHPYYLRASHANSILAAIPAAHAINNGGLSTEWALVGHSQGGHVVLATARAEQNPNFPLQAAVALAPGTDLMPISTLTFEAIDQDMAEDNLDAAFARTFFLNLNATFFAQAISSIEPSFDPKTLFGDTVANIMDIALDEENCGEYFDTLDGALFEHLDNFGTVADFDGLRRDWFEDPTVASLLAQEELNDEAQSTPLLIVQGDADLQIPLDATNDFVEAQRSLGTDVTYEVLRGGRHGDVAANEFMIAIDWLKERFAP